jgi:crotonobetainyl-CoA:carnitine CoA-transferase CaiB-like acyl-CoA transferase
MGTTVDGSVGPGQFLGGRTYRRNHAESSGRLKPFCRANSVTVKSRQIANARINSVEQFIDHPQLRGRNAWRQVDSPVGSIRALAPPVRMEGVEPVMGPIPALGQHRESILEELGFDRATIEQWKQEGVI